MRTELHPHLEARSCMYNCFWQYCRRIWSVDTGKEKNTPIRHDGWARSIAMGANGKEVLSRSSADNAPKIMMVNSVDGQGQVVQVLEPPTGDKVRSTHACKCVTCTEDFKSTKIYSSFNVICMYRSWPLCTSSLHTKSELILFGPRGPG